MITKYFVFAWDEYEEFGGMGDLQKVCDTFEEAEQSLPTLDVQQSSYGYWENAEIIAFNDNFTWQRAAFYINRQNKGWVKLEQVEA